MQYRPSGEAHYAWKGNAISDIIGRQRARRLYPVIGPCERCGSPKSERHHIDGNPRNNARENISILCRKCHMIVDDRIDPGPYSNKSSKLNMEKAREIRASSETLAVLAKRYGVTFQLISLIRLNRIWKERGV